MGIYKFTLIYSLSKIVFELFLMSLTLAFDIRRRRMCQSFVKSCGTPSSCLFFSVQLIPNNCLKDGLMNKHECWPFHLITQERIKYLFIVSIMIIMRRYKR
jgi:hypothetical protein